MPNTSLYSLPYAAPGDPADGAGNEQSMMTAVENTIKGPFVLTSTSNQNVINTASMVNDTQLFLPVVANATYQFWMDLRYGAASGVGIKIGFTVPAGSTMTWATYSLDGSVQTANFGGIHVGNQTETSTPALGYNTANTTIMHGHPQGTLFTSTSSGNLQFQFSATTLSASVNTIRYTNSLLWMKRIA